MVNNMDVEDLFLRMPHESAITSDDYLPLPSKQLKGCVSDGRQNGIACGKHPAAVDRFTEVKIIHIVTIQYNKQDVRNNHGGSTAVNKF